MSLKKAFCPYCSTKKLERHIFEVNENADVCYCPHCLHEFVPKEAIENYKKFNVKKLEEAHKFLFVVTDFEKAMEIYASFIEREDKNNFAHFGRIYCIVNMSTLRNNNFESAIALFNAEKSIYFRKHSEFNDYIKFLSRLNKLSDEYASRFPKLIFKNGKVYSQNFLSLYFKNNIDLISFKTAIKKELEYLKDQIDSNSVLKDKIELINISISELENRNKAEYTLVDNSVASFKEINEKGKVFLNVVTPAPIVKKSVQNHIKRIQKKSENVSDTVFIDNTKKYLFIQKTHVFVCLPGIFAIAFLTLSILFSNSFLFAVFFPVFVILIATCGGFIGLRYYWKKKLKQRNQEID